MKRQLTFPIPLVIFSVLKRFICREQILCRNQSAIHLLNSKRMNKLMPLFIFVKSIGIWNCQLGLELGFGFLFCLVICHYCLIVHFIIVSVIVIIIVMLIVVNSSLDTICCGCPHNQHRTGTHRLLECCEQRDKLLRDHCVPRL